MLPQQATSKTKKFQKVCYFSFYVFFEIKGFLVSKADLIEVLSKNSSLGCYYFYTMFVYFFI